MSDTREDILQRLFVILQGIPNLGTDPYIGGPTVYRNRDQLPDELRPGILLLDADETVVLKSVDNRDSSRTPTLVELKPEIYVCLKTIKPTNLDPSTNINVGTIINGYRLAILKAVMNDTTLQGLVRVGYGGSINFSAVITDLARNRTMMGEMGIAFFFTYPLIPSTL
jgi:hypothetical protein